MSKPTDGIEAVFFETHNWGRAARFFQSLGYVLEFDTGHSSGQLRNGESGPYVFVAEIPEDREPGVRLVLTTEDEASFRPGPDVELVSPFEDTLPQALEQTRAGETPFGTREAVVRAPTAACGRSRPANRPEAA